MVDLTGLKMAERKVALMADSTAVHWAVVTVCLWAESWAECLACLMVDHSGIQSAAL